MKSLRIIGIILTILGIGFSVWSEIRRFQEIHTYLYEKFCMYGAISGLILLVGVSFLAISSIKQNEI